MCRHIQENVEAKEGGSVEAVREAGEAVEEDEGVWQVDQAGSTSDRSHLLVAVEMAVTRDLWF